MVISYYAYPGINYSAMSKTQRINLKHGKTSTTNIKILRVVCKFYGISEDDVKRKDRRRDKVWCRQVYYFLSLKLTNMTQAELGRELNQDHTTVIHSRQTVQDILDSDPEKRKELWEIESKLT
jgi:chromosomal replication initiator protein